MMIMLHHIFLNEILGILIFSFALKLIIVKNYFNIFIYNEKSIFHISHYLTSVLDIDGRSWRWKRYIWQETLQRHKYTNIFNR